MNKNIVITVIIIIVIVLVGGIYLMFNKNQSTGNNQNNSTQQETQNSMTNQEQNSNNNPSSFDIQGMKVEVLQQGSGNGAKSGDTVTVNYVGTLQNGTKFDSSIDRGTPFSFKLGENSVIQGWELGILGMKAGEKRKLTIPPQLGYGSQAVGNVIPANSTLIFEVTMIKIN